MKIKIYFAFLFLSIRFCSAQELDVMNNDTILSYHIKEIRVITLLNKKDTTNINIQVFNTKGYITLDSTIQNNKTSYGYNFHYDFSDKTPTKRISESFSSAQPNNSKAIKVIELFDHNGLVSTKTDSINGIANTTRNFYNVSMYLTKSYLYTNSDLQDSIIYTYFPNGIVKSVTDYCVVSDNCSCTLSEQLNDSLGRIIESHCDQLWTSNDYSTLPDGSLEIISKNKYGDIERSVLKKDYYKNGLIKFKSLSSNDLIRDEYYEYLYY